MNDKQQMQAPLGTQDEYVLRMSDISKTYGVNRALDEVSFDLRPGEVHVLFGENGAGKSTLIKVLTGNVRPDAGTLTINGQSCGFLTLRGAKAAGISAVFQEFQLAPSLSVVDNLFLGREKTRRGILARAEMQDQARQVLAELGFAIDLEATVGTLTRAQRQMVEICKALLLHASILILDEPTASLNDHEADALLDVVRKLRHRGVGIIYVSHRMREIHEIADRVTVLRSGRYIGTLPRAGLQEAKLVEMMTGRPIAALYPEIRQDPRAMRIRISNLSTVNGAVKDASLTLRAGEIVGIAGLMGSGKSEIGQALFGLLPIRSGQIEMDGMLIKPRNPSAMLARHLCYFPPDRNVGGLAVSRPVLENGSMTGLSLNMFSRFGFLRRRNERSEVMKAMKAVRLRPLDLTLPVGSLSGGNMQKVLLARGLVRNTEVFVFDEPTVGIDVGAKAEIYDLLKSLVEQGAAVLMISSDLQEVLRLSNRVYVVTEGRTVAELRGDQKTEDNVLKGFFGHAPEIRKEGVP
ncbi:sugar ABC transporter ATP-binding protein [Actibacterium sp.]|uniref:sugar ABC transporter ATP-binding protein n=1 Tax=Actibacterium sp. TaxID=1872125 RepID=UPI00257AA13C|nr:sugar ABC transporter ATP-binding protein [Actibacterium sp.]